MSSIDTAKERDELVAHLRKTPGWPTLGNKAAAQIERDGREIERLREALSAMLDLQDNASPFGGEMYQDRVDRVFDQCRAALKGSDQ